METQMVSYYVLVVAMVVLIVVVFESPSPVQSSVTPWTVARPGSSVYGISQASILEWVAISFSRIAMHRR